MLVITRKETDTIVAGDITITVVKIKGGQVRLGIQAPDNTVINRGEVSAALKERGLPPMRITEAPEDIK